MIRSVVGWGIARMESIDGRPRERKFATRFRKAPMDYQRLKENKNMRKTVGLSLLGMCLLALVSVAAFGEDYHKQRNHHHQWR
jgi:hypothetical protein